VEVACAFAADTLWQWRVNNELDEQPRRSLCVVARSNVADLLEVLLPIKPLGSTGAPAAAQTSHGDHDGN
jgi:hypothetical protein